MKSAYQFATVAIGLLSLSACTTATTTAPVTVSPNVDMSTAPPSPDPRVGLRAGITDAGEASWNLRLVSNTPTPAPFTGATNSDLAFLGPYAIQGNYNGFMVWDVSNPARPMLTSSQHCPASQSDVSVYRNLLFVSGEGRTGRLDCGAQGVQDSVSHERLRGIRIFEISDIRNPKYIANVQTCRGSHTHTVATQPGDNDNVYIYVSGSSSVRSPSELPGCSALAPDEDPNSALFRIEVIRVPLARPQDARIVTSPRIFEDLIAPPGRDREGNMRPADPSRPGPSQCHDITTYPAVGLAGGACGGYGLLLDISDVDNPRRIDAAADPNMSYWHSATFSNDGSKVLFSDEWGGGSAPRCRETDKYEWGANALFTIENGKMVFQSYYKLPAPQTELENCVAHNGSLIPIPGREVMVQAWYQGGISVFDWTDAKNPKEIAFFDRGPLDPERMRSAGSWSVYWYNGDIISSEIARGLDIFELTPSAFISQNEIDAANTVQFTYLNAQEQQKLVWPASFSLARAYVDQLERSNGLSSARITAIRADLTRAERASGQQRSTVLTQLASQLHGEATRSSDQAKVHLLAGAVTDLSAAR